MSQEDFYSAQQNFAKVKSPKICIKENISA